MWHAVFARGARIDDEKVEGLLAKAIDGADRVGGDKYAKAHALELVAEDILQALVFLGQKEHSGPAFLLSELAWPLNSRRTSRMASSSCDGV